MNWKEIKDECPKAWECLRIWHNDNCGFIDHPDVWEMGMLDEDWELRHLYDFFDDNNVNIQISVKCALDNSCWYLAYIWCNNDGCDLDKHLRDKATRREAEQAAFERAFELLEEKL